MLTHLVIYSGGMDSFTLLHTVNVERRPDQPLIALSVDYDQKHRKELGYAVEVAKELGLAHMLVPMRFMRPLLRGSALTDTVDMPHGHYQAETMRKTVVPGRNTLLLSIGMAIAEGMLGDGEVVVYYGAHAGDHYIYPDCRPEYIAAMQRVFQLATDGRVQLVAPFQHLDKAEILRRGLSLGLDYSKTWTCYEGGDVACGKCGSCVERLAAFDAAGIEDPITYADRDSWKKNM